MSYFDEASIIFENEDFLVVVKAQNMPVQPTKASRENLLNLLEEFYEFKRGVENPYIGLVHRLDQPTGGVMVFAKNKQSAGLLSKSFQAHQTTKKYRALLHGKLEGSRGKLVHFHMANVKTNHVEVSDEPKAGSKQSILDYVVLGHKTVKGADVTLVEVTLQTGHQHQIRAQFSKIGHGLIGDRKYGVLLDNLPLMLWSVSLTFELKGEKFSFDIEPPQLLC